jgi:hypothetical protein
LYVPLFYGWQDNPFNSAAVRQRRGARPVRATIGDPDGGGDEEEPWLLEQFGVTLEQLRWRRVTIAEECGGDIEFFHQEHPATPEQAFIGSGRPVFPGILVAKMIKAAEKPRRRPWRACCAAMSGRSARPGRGRSRCRSGAVWVPRRSGDPRRTRTWGVRGGCGVGAPGERGDAGGAGGGRSVKPDGQYVVFADVAQGEGTMGDGDYTRSRCSIT